MIVNRPLPSAFWTGQTDELYGEGVLEGICLFFQSALTSETAFHTAVEIKYCNPLVILDSGSAGAVRTVHTAAPLSLWGSRLLFEPKDVRCLLGGIRFTHRGHQILKHFHDGF